jgi:DNA-binding GntR family transcriptional regulator
MSTLFPFEPTSLAERAYWVVREKILRGELRLGATLSRRKLASELGMSLVPVSEAFQRLESEGLLESTPRVGTRVYTPTRQDISERHILREALETQAARLFSEIATPHDRRELCRMAEHMDALFNRRLAEQDDPEFNYQVMACHFQFHMKVAESTRCRPLIKMIEQTHVLVFNWVWDIAAKRPVLPLRSHRDLADTLVGRDPEKSDAAMRLHIRQGVERTVHHIQSSPKMNLIE